VGQNKLQFSGRWNTPGKSIKINLPLILFEEDGQQIAFCPALDISGYGNSEKEAIDAFSISIGEYLLYTINKGTLQKDLEVHGWTVRKSIHKPMVPPDMSYLLGANNEFNRVFNTHDFKKINHSVNMPASA
jgi:hypothetical protein